MHAGPDGRAPRRHEGARRPGGRLPGERGELADLLRDLKRRGPASPGAGGRRRRAGVLGGRPRRVAGDGGATVLGPPDRQRAGQAPDGLQPRAKRALHEIMHAETRAAAEREIDRFAAAYQAKYPKAVSLADRRPGPAADVLRLPGRALEAPADDEPDRVDVRHGAAARGRDEGRGLADGRARRWPSSCSRSRTGHWRNLNAPELVPLVRAGVRFEDGVQSRAAPQKREKRVA